MAGQTAIMRTRLQRKERDLKKRYKKRLLVGACIALPLLVGLAGLDSRLKVTEYTVQSEKVTAPVRLALLTDLHSCDYGQAQQELLEAVTAQEPDLVLLCGDIVDDGPEMPEERALFTVEAPVSYTHLFGAGGHSARGGVQ